jgi:hypothetical protein
VRSKIQKRVAALRTVVFATAEVGRNLETDRPWLTGCCNRAQSASTGNVAAPARAPVAKYDAWRVRDGSVDVDAWCVLGGVAVMLIPADRTRV